MDSNTDEFLEHFGVKGMRWGVRRDDLSGVSRKTNKEARKDAEESARAKMYFGKGAGTRRKLINKTVEAKKGRDSDYARAFDHHFARQDLSEHASGARTERARTDRKERTRQRAGYVARSVTGEAGTQAAFAAVVIGGAAFLNSQRGRAMMGQAASFVRDQASTARGERMARNITSMLRNQGL